MKVTRNPRAISNLLLVLLLLTALIIGAVLSYLWIIGYYINLGIRTPDKTSVSITDATFSPQNTSFFNITILNPSYSPADSDITQIVLSTEDGILHEVMETRPSLPYRLPKAEDESFVCDWNWENYTGEIVQIIAFVAGGSGPTFEVRTPYVDLEITEVIFNSTLSFKYFNLTVQNSQSSATNLDISKVTVDQREISAENLSIPLPHTLEPDESVSFSCSWDWSEYQGKNATIVVNTLQGYIGYYTDLIPRSVILSITNILFDVNNTTHFKTTVHNSNESTTYVDLEDITVTVGNETLSPNPVILTPQLPYSLHPANNITFNCLWNWTSYREKNVTVTLHTLQGIRVSSMQATPARVILAIRDVLYDITDPSYFNITVHNTKHSLESHVNLTKLTVNVKGEVQDVAVPALSIFPNESITFSAYWTWSSYWNEEVMITVYADDYSANYFDVTPSPLTISNVSFNIIDTARFNVTVENSIFFSASKRVTYVLITNITAILENDIYQEVEVIAPTLLPYVLHRNDSVSFVCSWDWTEYREKNVTVTVHTSQSYTANRTVVTPDAVMLTIPSIQFDEANATYFNMTVNNSEYSLMQVTIERIVLTFQNGTKLEPTVDSPPIPYSISPNENVTFKCLWNWFSNQGENFTATVETMENYEVSKPQTIPFIP